MIFCNKINNIIKSAEAFGYDKSYDMSLEWNLCNELGLEHTHDELVRYFKNSLTFNEYLLRVQCLLNILFSNEHKEQYGLLAYTVQKAIENSPMDLGLRLKITKKHGAQIYFSGSKLLDSKLVDDVLGIVSEQDKKSIQISFEKGLKEFVESRNDINKLRNVVRDMQVSCDETIKYKFKDKNLGLKHLFKDSRWKAVGLNEYQKQIYWNLNEYIDKFAKHSADKEFNYEDAENIIYLTGLFIRLVLLKK